MQVPSNKVAAGRIHRPRVRPHAHRSDRQHWFQGTEPGHRAISSHRFASRVVLTRGRRRASTSVLLAMTALIAAACVVAALLTFDQKDQCLDASGTWFEGQ